MICGVCGKTTFNNVVEMHAPLRTRRVRLSKSPWITPELKRHMHERDILKIKAIRSKDIYDWAAFKKARNSVNSEIKFVKKAHYMNAFHENESSVKKTWGIINELTSRKQNNSHVKEIKLNGSSVSDPPGLSEAFNTHNYQRRLTLQERINTLIRTNQSRADKEASQRHSRATKKWCMGYS